MLNETEIWNKVKSLKNITLLTYVEQEPNYITEIQDTGNANDMVIIKGRATFPIREDIIAAYNLLFALGQLERKKDLEWLAQPNKKTSSIIFRMVGEIVKDEANVVAKGNNIIIKLIK